MIPFNKPFFTGNELKYIQEAVGSGKISGDGVFSRKCQEYLEKRYLFHKVLLTSSCTDALEMAAILCDISQGDEVIAPSYTFVSTVNAFVLRGAKIVFADSEPDNPNIDERQLASLVTNKTKVIVPVHYAGVSCNMDNIINIANTVGAKVVEDAAQAIDSYYYDRPLGSLGSLGTFSFHETKNIIAGEGGALTINDPGLVRRAEIIREKGTNRAAFFRGEVDKYGWVDVGSSYLPSEITAAFLLAQLESTETIQSKRKQLWNVYLERLTLLEDRGAIRLPVIPPYASNNAHMFYLLCDDLQTRSKLITFLKNKGVMAVFHYQSLHSSPFFSGLHDGRMLPNADRYSNTLVRLPLYFELDTDQVNYVCDCLFEFFEG